MLNPVTIRSFVALRRSVSDLPRALAFYCDGLGFTVEADKSGSSEATLALGSERIVLVTAAAHAPCWVAAAGPDVRFQHVAIVTRDMAAAFARLEQQAPTPISQGGPQRLPATSGGVTAFKFRDPDGHPLELIEFPDGQGAPRWQRKRGLMLGLDHAAISVSDVAASIGFYRRLGFEPGARQINHGPEQARLDGLDQARVDVVAMMPPGAAEGSHLELLGYLTPAPVRSAGGAHEPTADRLIWQAQAAPDGRQPRVQLEDPDHHRHEIAL